MYLDINLFCLAGDAVRSCGMGQACDDRVGVQVAVRARVRRRIWIQVGIRVQRS